MENSRPSHQVHLITKDGKPAKGVVKRPTSSLRAEVRKIGRRITLLNEEYTARFMASTEINKQITEAKSPEDIAEAIARRDLLEKKLEEMDAENYGLQMQRFGMIINVSKGDAESAPEIDWMACDEDEMNEALIFFTTGKLLSTQPSQS